MEKQRIAIVIDGSTYHVLTDEDELHVMEVAGMVDRQIQSVRKSAPQLTPTMTAVLGAMNLADEAVKLKKGAAESELVAAQRAEVKRLTEKLAHAQAQAKAAEETAEQTDEKVLFLQRKLTEKQERIEALERQAEDAPAVETLTARIKMLEDSERQLRAALEKQAGEVSEREALENRIQTLEAREEDLVQQLETQTGQLEALEADNAALKERGPADEPTDLTRQLEECEEKVFYLQRRLTDKEEELRHARKELEDFIDEFEQS